MKELLTKQFDLKLKHERRELAEMEEEMDEFRMLLKKREANRERIISRRMSELSGDEEDLHW